MNTKHFAAALLIIFFLLVPMMVTAKGDKEKQPENQQATESMETAAPADEKPEGAVARVNGIIITEDDFNDELSRMKITLAQSGRPVTDADLQELEKVVLDGLISRELLFEASEAGGYLADEEAVQQQYTAIAGQFSDDETFAEALAAQELTPEILREELKRGLSIQRLIEEKVNSSVSVSEEETRSYYDENPDMFFQPEMVKASHIITLASPEDKEEVKKAALDKITEIQGKLKQGADFAETAREFSEGPSNTQGGELGFFARGQMVPEFEEAAFSLAPGEISDIVQTDFGYHLIKVSERKEASTVPYEDVGADIENFLLDQKLNAAIDSYIMDLRDKADVTIF